MNHLVEKHLVGLRPKSREGASRPEHVRAELDRGVQALAPAASFEDLPLMVDEGHPGARHREPCLQSAYVPVLANGKSFGVEIIPPVDSVRPDVEHLVRRIEFIEEG